MTAPVRLALFAAALAAVFAVAFVGARLLVPAEAAAAWADRAAAAGEPHGDEGAAHDGGAPGEGDAHDGGAGHDDGGHGADAVTGLPSTERGHRLADLTAPTAVGEAGRLSFAVLGPDGRPVDDYDVEHERELHLIVLRTDGAGFRHVHPERDDDGTWSLPWTWDAAGTYRVFADTAPADLGDGVVLAGTVQVAGDLGPPAPPPAQTTVATGPYTVTLDGRLDAGDASTLAFVVERDGRPVELEPYLGANGHLVALRQSDLAYLHVHPEHDETADGASRVAFAAEVPTAGEYLLYLDFQVDGVVHTAAFRMGAS